MLKSGGKKEMVMSLMMTISGVLFLMLMSIASAAEARGNLKIFDVRGYGAKADGRTDNAQVFLRAWEDACEWNGKSGVLIPAGTYLVGSVAFTGPCKKSTAFLVKGVLKAPTDMYKMTPGQWIAFRYVDGLRITGGGTFDGQGASAWNSNDCATNSNCPKFPISLLFDFVTNSRVSHIKSVNSKNAHIQLFGCNNFTVSKIRITAPGESPNTDGIKIGGSNSVEISASSIGTGDDCIAILSGNTNITVSDLKCGPGHGISVGSQGGYPNEKNVQGLTVKNITFTGTTNGLRIKTKASPYASVLSGFTFEEIQMNDVANPIIIDQLYCPHPPCDQQTASHVQIKDVTYKNIWGTSTTKVAVNLQCSQIFPCKNIVLNNIHLHGEGNNVPTNTSCSYVNGASYGKQIPTACF